MKRKIEFDYIRSFVLIFLPIVHVLELSIENDFMSLETISQFDWIVKISSIGPTIFMLCLGINIGLSLHSDYKSLLNRSLKTFIIGLLLNIIRYIIPGVVSMMLSKDDRVLHNAIYFSISSDILFFASLAFLFFAFCKRYNLNKYTILCIGLFLSIVDSYVNLNNDSTLFNALIGNFIYVNEDSIFSFTQWLIFPCIGYLVICLYEKIGAKKLWKNVIIFCPLMLIIDLTFNWLLKTNFIDILGCQRYSANVNLNGAIILCLIGVILFAAAYYFSKLIKNKKINEIIISFSKNILVYYITQWLVISVVGVFLFVIGFFPNQNIDNKLFIIITLICVILSIYLSMLWYNKIRKKEKNYRYDFKC